MNKNWRHITYNSPRHCSASKLPQSNSQCYWQIECNYALELVFFNLSLPSYASVTFCDLCGECWYEEWRTVTKRRVRIRRKKHPIAQKQTHLVQQWERWDEKSRQKIRWERWQKIRWERWDEIRCERGDERDERTVRRERMMRREQGEEMRYEKRWEERDDMRERRETRWERWEMRDDMRWEKRDEKREMRREKMREMRWRDEMREDEIRWD